MSKHRRENKNHIKKILKELNIEFETMRSDTNLYYFVEYLPKEFSENIGSITILIHYSFDLKMLIVICPNIYRLKNGDSTLNIFYALNNTNTKLLRGNVTLIKNHICYRYQEEFKSIELITKEKLEIIFNDVLIASIYTYEEIKRMKNNEE